MFLWPNGEGIGLRNQGLWVRVPPGTLFCYINFYCLAQQNYAVGENIGELLISMELVENNLANANLRDN